jgi:hypothetical protein
VSDLQFVAISDDGKMIILQTADGQWIEVPFDASLVANTSERAEVIALEPQSDQQIAMSPREIQARIRGGSSVEEVAQMSGSSAERIMAYAPPILLERTHVAIKAAKTIVRRASGAGPLADVIHARLAPLGVLIDDIAWDSFRREDGRWSVVVRYPTKEGQRTAIWLFDVRNSALVPGDDEARWLVGEAGSKAAHAASADPNSTPTITHLVSVPTFQDPAGSNPSRSETRDHPTDPVLGLKLARLTESDTQDEPIEDSDQLFDEDMNQDLNPDTDQDENLIDDPSLGVDEDQAEEDEIKPGSAFDRLTKPDKSSSKRPRVPSWDEILFGAPPTDDV